MSMTLGDEVCTFLQGQGLGLNFNAGGTINLFSSLLPDQPDFAVAVVERGGLPTVLWMTGSNPRVNESRLDQPVFQVLTRSGMTGYMLGSTTVHNVFGALQGIVEQTLNAGGALFHLIDAMQSPMYLGRDEKERHQWSQSFRVMWENPLR